jgi:hypothetical protein
MAQYTSYDQVGAKEDVSDIISNLTPTKTPFQSMIGSETTHNTIFQWQEDELRAVQANAQIEGFTATDATLTPTVMRSNYTQILEKTIKVAGSADKRDTYGRAKESAYQMAKAMKEVKRDLEYAFVGTKQTAVAGSSSVARKFAGVQAQVDASLINTTTGGIGTPIGEAILLTTLQELWTAGADPSHLMVTADDSLIVSDFAKASGRTREIKNGTADRQIVNVVDLYISPFGEVKVVLNRFLAAGDSLVFEPGMWSQVTFRNWFRETLAKDGDNLKMMVVGEFSLKHKNYKGSAVIRRQSV